MKKTLLAILMTIFLCGCLPPGEPPKGNITGNDVTFPKNKEEIKESVITELAAIILSHGYDQTFSLDCDKTSAADMLDVWRECRKLTGIKSAENSPWKIISRNNNSQWTIKILHENKVISTISYFITVR